uniref:Transposase n=1 Tax=Plectus sambesii TaxID=2011161 RepID=A0A914WMF2_9BILA
MVCSTFQQTDEAVKSKLIKEWEKVRQDVLHAEVEAVRLDFNLATRDDKKMANALKTMLDNAVDWDEFETEDEEKLELEEDSEPEDDPDYEDEDAPENHVRFNNTFVPADKVQSAIEFFREPTKGSRPLHEPRGQFPQRGHFTASNLLIDCHKSHMMTKQLMMNWLKECVINPDMPDKMLLIVDSWSSFKDHDSIQTLVPHGKTLVIRNIPPGATSKIQPLDVYFFLTFKGFVKRFTGYVSNNELEIKLQQRDNILKMLSLAYNQFCAPRFQHFLQYSWHSSGYVDEHPPPFLTPIQFCFSPYAVQPCQFDGCEKISLINCAFCDHFLCFDHFFRQFHYHEV